MSDSYTRYPRTIFWLLREGQVTIGGTEPDAQPPFNIEVQPFYIGKTPISNRQFEAFEPGHRRSAVSPGDDDPAVGISHTAATAYCAWYAEISRKPIRLPTEIEWEYACRGGTTGRTFFGDDPAAADRFVWDGDNSGGALRPLEQKKPNPYGLYAMLGGVWEWTASRYLPYPAKTGDGRDDPGPGDRVLRGGSFRTGREQLACGLRRAAPPDLRDDDVGFRIVRSLR